MKKLFNKDGEMRDWELRFSEDGYRITAPRRAVMEVLMEAQTSLSPQEIWEQGRSVHRGLGLVTVYRTLDVLSKMHLVRRVHREDGCHGYLPTSPGHRHALICRRCGQGVDFAGGDDLEAMITTIETQTGYCIDGHLLQLFGLCPGCRQSQG
jgi:Fur family ferric uptake transcriptional regulator